MATYIGGGQYYLSEPATVFWAGFQSDTITLQREGWSFTAEYENHHDAVRIAMRNDELNMTGLSRFTPYEMMGGPRWSGRGLHYLEFKMVAVGDVRVFKGEMMDRHGPRYRAFHHPEPVSVRQFRDWHPVDMEPQIVTEEAVPLASVLAFAPVATKQLILPEAKVPDLMARILELQEPARMERIRDDVKRKVHAQIISI